MLSTFQKKVISLVLLSVLSSFFWNHRFFGEDFPKESDAGQHVCIAQDLWQKQSYTSCGESTVRDPGYSVILAVFFAQVSTHPDAFRFFQIFLFCCATVFLYLFARKITHEHIAYIAATGLAASWFVANYTGLYLREVVLVFMVLITLEVFRISGMNKKIGWILSAGILLALLSFLNSIMQFFVVFAVLQYVFLWRRKEMPIREILLKSLLFFMAFSAVFNISYDYIGTLRGDEGHAIQRAGHVLALRAEAIELVYPDIWKYYLGHSVGYYFMQWVDPELDTDAFYDSTRVDAEYERRLRLGQSHQVIEAAFLDESLEKLRANIPGYISVSILDLMSFQSPLFPRKLFNGNTRTLQMFVESGDLLGSVPLTVGVLLTIRFAWYGLLALVIYGAWIMRKKWEDFGWMIIWIVYLSGVYAAVHAIPRYALPLYPYYFLLASIGGHAVWERVRMSRGKTSLVIDKKH